MFQSFTALIGIPLGWVMWLLYRLVNDYAIALLLFTIFSRAIMVPVTINQQKGTAKMTMLRPQLEELQKKYANNKQKLNEEMMALYSKEGYNPMSGCLPMAVQFIVLFGIIDVIYKPLNHILHLPSEVVSAAQDVVAALPEYSARALSSQLPILQQVSVNPGLFSSTISKEYVNQMIEFVPKMFFLGIDLMQTPSVDMLTGIFSGFNPVILIPILSGATSLIFSLYTMKTTSANLQGQAGAGSMKAMMLTMPIFSTWFTFSVPAGVGLYWTYANVVGLVQTLLVNKIFNPKEMAEKARLEFEQRKERERKERIEAKKKAKEEGVAEDDKALSKKELARKKLAEARRRDAEKYGEAYSDVGDDDL